MVVGDLVTQVDLAILGAGPGGYVAAIRAAQLDLEVALIDPRPPGGTCLHATCIPARALLRAVGAADGARTLSHMGVEVQGVSLSWPKMQAWKRQVVDGLSAGVATLLERHGVTVVQGRGWFMDQDEIRVEGVHGSQRFQCEHAIVATGAAAAVWPGLDLDGARVLNAAQALALEGVPKTVTVVGADGSAASLAGLFSGAGSAIRWIRPAGAALLAPFDPLVARYVTQALVARGVEVLDNVEDLAAATAEAERVVVTGRWRGRTDALHLDEVGLEPDESGFLLVDPRQRTANPRILAVGDVTGPPFLAGLASQQGEVAAEVCAGLPSASESQAIPHVIWTTPQAAMVGMTKEQAEAVGYDVAEGRFPLSASGAARIAGADEGATLVVADAESGVVLGVTMVGPAAAERIGQAALALEMGATLTDLQATLQPHPTYAETIPEAAADALGRAIHLYHPR